MTCTSLARAMNGAMRPGFAAGPYYALRRQRIHHTGTTTQVAAVMSPHPAYTLAMFLNRSTAAAY